MNATIERDLLREVEQFVFMEARLADELRYDDWEALWTDDGVYWVPANGQDSDPTKQVSIIFDNRSRIATRIRQLHSGKRHAQTPASSLRRLITSVELLGEEEGDVLVGANFLVAEARAGKTAFWAGRVEYRLRRNEGGFRMARKKVVLVDNDQPLHTMSFLI
ncbi:MAG: aromatic-ring-hydroxylating dioxygenase subunit beta [Solirubrobacterales bacterium]